MKKIICKREYDTETATLVKKHTVGEFGDPAGYEETPAASPSAPGGRGAGEVWRKFGWR